MLDLINEESHVRTDLLFLALLGPSSAGKSYAVGSLEGKILYLHSDEESHGVASARKGGGDLLSVCYDKDKSGPLKPDAAYKRLLECLKPEVVQKASVTAIVVDGMTSLEKLVRETELFKNKCTSGNGKYDKFSEVPTTNVMLDSVWSALRRVQSDLGLHVVVLGILDVQEADRKTGAIELAAPRLSGYGVAVTALQQFPDILAIGKYKKPDGTEVRPFQTGATVSKISKASKEEGGHVKKFINFDCRLALPHGVELPAFIKADLKEVIKLKTEVKV